MSISDARATRFTSGSRDFDESKIRRQPKGTSVGGQFAPKDGPATALYNQSFEETTVDEVLDESDPRARQMIEDVKNELASRAPTDAPVEQGGHKNADGTWTDERQQLHLDIISSEFTQDRVEAATPLPGQKPVVVMLGGRSGAGKTSFLNESGQIDQSKFLMINADSIQEKLPGYAPRLAGLYNAEAQGLSTQVEEIARAKKLNVIYDATMKTQGGAAQRIRDYKAAGYDVEGYFIHTSPKASAKNAVSRFVGGGRYIPVEYVLSHRTNEVTFDSLLGEFKRWAIYDNTKRQRKRVAKGGF